MPVESKDLHGNVPDESGTALLLIDVINDFEFEGGENLLPLALPVGKAIAELKQAAKQAGIPAIYVNDNFGKWQSDLNKIVSHCLEDKVRGKAFVEMVLPEEDDYFVLKPKHSGFYSTTLELLLEHLGARSLILTGIAGNNCVLCCSQRTMPTCAISNSSCPLTASFQKLSPRTSMPWNRWQRCSRLIRGRLWSWI